MPLEKNSARGEARHLALGSRAWSDAGDIRVAALGPLNMDQYTRVVIDAAPVFEEMPITRDAMPEGEGSVESWPSLSDAQDCEDAELEVMPEIPVPSLPSLSDAEENPLVANEPAEMPAQVPSVTSPAQGRRNGPRWLPPILSEDAPLPAPLPQMPIDRNDGLWMGDIPAAPPTQELLQSSTRYRRAQRVAPTPTPILYSRMVASGEIVPYSIVAAGGVHNIYTMCPTVDPDEILQIRVQLGYEMDDAEVDDAKHDAKSDCPSLLATEDMSTDSIQSPAVPENPFTVDIESIDVLEL